jgi:cytochrome oxidase Cu insertion factor (SCO1/SenC/PrrC family)
MKKLAFVFTLLMFAFSVANSQEQEEDANKVKTGDTMPAFTIVSDNGKQTPSSEFRGNVLLVTMFTTWCPSCQLEMA